MTEPLDLDARKAIARRFGMGWTDAPLCERYYPKCCQYHQGLDDALLALTQVGWCKPGKGSPSVHDRSDTCDTWGCEPVYTLKGVTDA